MESSRDPPRLALACEWPPTTTFWPRAQVARLKQCHIGVRWSLFDDTEVKSNEDNCSRYRSDRGIAACWMRRRPICRGHGGRSTGKEQCNRLRTSVAQTRCLVAMGNRYIRPTINKNQLDLYDLGAATKLALAEKVDAGQMTRAEADLEMAQTLSHIASEGQQRDTNSTIAWAAWKSQLPRVQSCQAVGSSYSAMVTCL